jgi:IS30 family transposase
MDQLDYTQKRSFTQLNLENRIVIQTLLAIGKTQSFIASHLGVHKSTVSREIKRNVVTLRDYQDRPYTSYEGEAAQNITNKRNKNSHKKPKHIGQGAVLQKIRIQVKEKRWSLDVVAGRMKLEGEPVTFCSKTLYNYMHQDLLGLSNWDMPRMQPGRWKRSKPVAKRLSKGNSIEQRPLEVSNRLVPFHWEADCVVGPKNQGHALLTLSERTSRTGLFFRIERKTAESVLQTFNHLEGELRSDFRNVFQSVTTDNGPEFLDFNALQTSSIDPCLQRTIQYFAHPYSSWERGSNENLNRDLRVFFPKGTRFENISDRQIRNAQHKINHRPRKILGYKTPFEVFSETLRQYDIPLFSSLA